MDNIQISRNCFVIIYRHLTKVSSQINKCIIFKPNELSIALSTLWPSTEIFNLTKYESADVRCKGGKH